MRKFSRLAASENDRRRRKFRSGCDDENAEATTFLEKVLQMGIEDRPSAESCLLDLWLQSTKKDFYLLIEQHAKAVAAKLAGTGSEDGLEPTL